MGPFCLYSLLSPTTIYISHFSQIHSHARKQDPNSNPCTTNIFPFAFFSLHLSSRLIDLSSTQMRRMHSHPYRRQCLGIPQQLVRKSPYIFFPSTYRYMQDVMVDVPQVAQVKPEVNHPRRLFSWAFFNLNISSCLPVLPYTPSYAFFYW